MENGIISFEKDDLLDQWHQQRWGRFTSSEIFKLFSKGVGQEMFGVGALTYIRDKALERLTMLTERPELENVKSLRRGKMLEGQAFREYVRVTHNRQMQYFGTDNPVFIVHDDDSGGSPDGAMGQGELVVWGAEVKCPSKRSIHMDHRALKKQTDLEVYNFQYYAQIQHLLGITGAQGWHFFSYDDRFTDPRLRTGVLEVTLDKKFQDNLEIRLKMACKRRDQMIEQYLNE